MPLTEEQTERYLRNIMLEPVGTAGQETLLASKVLVIGTGGLGSPAALYLAAAGVGTIGIADGDHVDITNLQRQILHGTADIGRQKTASAMETIEAINPDVTIRTHEMRATADCISDILKGYDFVIDAVDNYASKFLINDACYFAKLPFCHAGISCFEGQTMTVLPGRTTCYRCVFGETPSPDSVPPPSQAGVLGAVPGVIGSIQATEAIKYLLGIGDLLTDSLLTYDALAMRFHKVPVTRNPNCHLCGRNPTITELKDD
jgi:molybdopterin/thiamine biosynthesis adenylyltransferase